MTRNRNLGPVLAIVGGVVVVAAVIAGFVVIGGPGDARERRLDDITMSRIESAVTTAQCAFNVTGNAPASIEEASRVRPDPTDATSVPMPCGNDDETAHLITDDRPAALGEATYRAVDNTHIRVCGNFRRPRSAQDNDRAYALPDTAYPQLSESRPAGIHCYEIELISGKDPPPSHAGHMDIFE